MEPLEFLQWFFGPEPQYYPADWAILGLAIVLGVEIGLIFGRRK